MLVKLLYLLALLMAREAGADSAKKYEDFILKVHNDDRTLQHANNMQKLGWNETLADIAGRWIAHCNFEHEGKGYGENLYFESNPEKDDITASFEAAMKAWYDEIELYQKGNTVSCGPTASCHYTQMVWYRTRQVGCAYKVCPSFTFLGRTQQNILYIGCWYDPKGNYANQKPFEVGKECSHCYEGQTCENGLCAGEGEEKCENKNENCIMYAAQGDCKKNKGWMEMECRQACGFCSGGELVKCFDIRDDCSLFVNAAKKQPGNALEKTCQRPYMQQFCRKSCDACGKTAWN